MKQPGASGLRVEQPARSAWPPVRLRIGPAWLPAWLLAWLPAWLLAWLPVRPQVWLIVGLIAGLAAGLGCSGKPPAEPGAAALAAGGVNSPACQAVRPRVEQLYRAEAQAREPARVDEAVADNTTMVMNDCGRAPDKVAACVRSVDSAPQLEARCLIPLDDEGTEGERRGR